jgi:hypothetical protein
MSKSISHRHPGREEEEDKEALPDTVNNKWKYYINGNSERIPRGEKLYKWWDK